MNHKHNIDTETVAAGKIVLDRTGDEVVLRGNLHQGGWAQSIFDAYSEDKVDEFEVGEFTRGLVTAEWLGFHRDIPTQGEVVGGGILLVFSDKYYYHPGSTDFGSAPAEEVQKCLDKPVERV